MIHFDCDYMAGAHPEVLATIVKNNAVQTAGYGYDPFCDHAKELIRQACGAPDATVYFMIGGTQTNSTIIHALLRPTDGVLAPETGHVNVHESGAVELFCHKVLALKAQDGKIHADQIEDYVSTFYADDTNEHMVAPGMVYITFPTELGTIYSLNELEEISKTCHRHNIPLYIDGARMGYGIAASDEVTLKDIARLSDVFYIGGTKMGALLGEAVVCTNPTLLKRFFPLQKAHGAVLAKGRLIGMQFETLFSNDLYFHIGQHGVRMAHQLREAFENKGYKTFINSPTNQQFFTLPNEVIDQLLAYATFEYWGPRGEKESKVRFVTSWETTEEDIKTLAQLI